MAAGVAPEGKKAAAPCANYIGIAVATALCSAVQLPSGASS